MKDIAKTIREAIDETMKPLNEAYVAQPARFDLKTELLSPKAKKAKQEEFEASVAALNRTSAELDGAEREGVDDKGSRFRQLKLEEVHHLNSSFLRAMHLQNISDLGSRITMDMLCYMRIVRDFGSFDAWQKDFIACAMSSRNGFAMLGYSLHLRRYLNFVIDGNDLSVPMGVLPVIVLDVSDSSYFRDYLNNRLAYVHGMMKEFNWGTVEERVEKCERIAKVGY
jgi:Fe-Mn family superoxide dismutase